MLLLSAPPFKLFYSSELNQLLPLFQWNYMYMAQERTLLPLILQYGDHSRAWFNSMRGFANFEVDHCRKNAACCIYCHFELCGNKWKNICTLPLHFPNRFCVRPKKDICIGANIQKYSKFWTFGTLTPVSVSE